MDGFKNTLLKKIDSLSKADKEIFDSIYTVFESTGELKPPIEMQSYIESTFGSLKDVEKQDFLRIVDKVTYEGAIFNELRTMRPLTGDKNFTEVIEQIELAKNGPFTHPLTATPADTFGRIKGEYCITASNIAKYDGLHGLVIFNDHNPLLFSRKRVRDYFDVASKWFEKAHHENQNAIYPFFTWNCLWRAGASIIHGHAQVALASDQAYAKIEMLRNLSHKYQETYRRNYFDSVYNIHKKIGLAFERKDVKIISRITPIKEMEVMIINHGLDDHLADVVSDTLNAMKENLGVASFNLSIILPPMTNTTEVWSHMPIIVRIVDRGNLSAKTADIGAMELYAQSVIGTNPYLVYEKLHKALLK